MILKIRTQFSICIFFKLKKSWLWRHFLKRATTPACPSSIPQTYKINVSLCQCQTEQDCSGTCNVVVELQPKHVSSHELGPKNNPFWCCIRQKKERKKIVPHLTESHAEPKVIYLNLLTILFPYYEPDNLAILGLKRDRSIRPPYRLKRNSSGIKHSFLGHVAAHINSGVSPEGD